MPRFTPALAREYETLFYSAQIKPAARAEVDRIVAQIAKNKTAYEVIELDVKTPWYLVACIHLLECSLDFSRHLHNGDPLTARTVNVPKGRPKTGMPPFAWRTSAIDALTYEELVGDLDWSLAYILFRLEGYNGYGYRTFGIPSPYLWSFTQHYVKGKFVKDGVFSPNVVSKQMGVACILRRMAETGLITPANIQPIAPTKQGAVKFGDKGAAVLALQKLLNQTPGILLREDGDAGPRTSEAFYRVYGVYLEGDARANSNAA